MSSKLDQTLARIQLPTDTAHVLRPSDTRTIVVPRDRAHLIDLALGGVQDHFQVAYDIPQRGCVVEAEVVRCRNGIAVNMPEPYMRRRDPDCMVVADDEPSDKPRFADRFKVPFDDWRTEILAWLAEQSLIVLPFRAGRRESNYDALLIVPANAAFFAASLADLQGMLGPDELPDGFKPRAVIYVAPPFRHTHCDGKQVVIHHRLAERARGLRPQPVPRPQCEERRVRRAVGDRRQGRLGHRSRLHRSGHHAIRPRHHHHARGCQRRRQERDARVRAPRTGRPAAAWETI